MTTTLRFTDDFAGAGDLNGSAVGATGATWSALAGAWARTSGAAKTTAAVSSNPMLVMEAGVGDVDVQANAYTGFAGGDALYFRVSDTANWWRLRQRAYSQSYSYYGDWYGTGWGNRTRSEGGSIRLPDWTEYFDYQHGIPTRRVDHVWNGLDHMVEFTYTQSVTRDLYSGTSSYRYLMLEKSVAGVVSGVTNVAVSAFKILRVATSDATIQIYQPNGLDVARTVTDGFNSEATKHGIGLGGSDSGSYASALDNFVLQRPGMLTPPSIAAPVSGSDVSAAAPLVVSIESNYGPGNDMQQVDVRYAPAGTGTWTEVDAARVGPGDWTVPTAGFTAPAQIEVQARSTDSFSNLSEWSPSSFFWLREAPAPPTFIAPAVNDTVVAANIATLDMGADATAFDGRRVTDNAGAPDETRIIEDDLTFTPDGAYWRVSGTNGVHDSGFEHIQVRRQTTAGGKLWSEWATLRVGMQLAFPRPPYVRLTPLEADAAVQMQVTFQGSDLENPPPVRLDIFRDGVRIVSVDVTGLTGYTWTDVYAGPTNDYMVQAIADTGGVVTVR